VPHGGGSLFSTKKEGAQWLATPGNNRRYDPRKNAVDSPAIADAAIIGARGDGEGRGTGRGEGGDRESADGGTRRYDRAAVGIAKTRSAIAARGRRGKKRSTRRAPRREFRRCPTSPPPPRPPSHLSSHTPERAPGELSPHRFPHRHG
jgi:hypothetical protein